MNEVIEKEKNEIIVNDVEIRNKIYVIRGQEEMLDSDLALLYQCKNGTKSINLAVKRNINKFPKDFYFQLNDKESYDIRFQFETKYSSIETRGGKYKNPFVFTEQGVAMLASVIHTETAEEMSVRIMRAFVAMRHFIIQNQDIYKSIANINNKIIGFDKKMFEYDEKFTYLFSMFNPKDKLFLKGSVYDAYSEVLDILKRAKEKIIIIDSYADKTIFDTIRNIECEVILIVRNSPRLNDELIKKYNLEYHNLKVVRDNSFHDRYIVVDKKDVYYLGSSINSIGSKTSIVSLIHDDIIKNTLIDNIEKIIKEKCQIMEILLKKV